MKAGVAGCREGQSRAENSGDTRALCAVFRGAPGGGPLRVAHSLSGALWGLLCLDHESKGARAEAFTGVGVG